METIKMYFGEKVKKMKKQDLYPRINFLTGVGSVLSIDGNYYEFNTFKSGTEADNNAMYNDWSSVGESIKGAIKEVSLENE